MELGAGESELNFGWDTLKGAVILPDEDGNSGQKTVLGELGQRQRPTHLSDWCTKISQGLSRALQAA